MDEKAPLLRLREAAGIDRKRMGQVLRISAARVHQIEVRDPIPTAIGLRILERFPAECEALCLTLESILSYRRLTAGGKVRRAGRGKVRIVPAAPDEPGPMEAA